MQIRTFIGILVSLGIVTLLAGLAYQNQGLLDQSFQITQSRSVPLWSALVGAFIAGVLVFVVLFLLRGSADLVERWRMLQGRRAGRAADELYHRGVAAVLEGREEKALEHFHAILQRDPEHFMALLKAGAVLRTLKRLPEAVDHHKRAHRLREKDLEPLYELVRDYEALDQVAKSKVVLNRIIELRPRRALSAYRKLRKYAIKEGDWERAWELQGLIENRIERTPYKLEAERRYSVGIQYEMAVAAARVDRIKESLNGLRKLARTAPEFVPAHVKLGELLVSLGQTQDALAVWASGFEQTGSAVFLSHIEEFFLSKEDPEGAIQALQEAISRAHRDFLPRFFLAKLYMRLEMIDEAHREFKTLVGRASSSPTLSAHLGYVYERRQEYEKASMAYREVVKDQEYLNLQYRCQVCDERYDRWADRCDVCGEWNQVTLDFREDPTLEELDVSTGPAYSRTA